MDVIKCVHSFFYVFEMSFRAIIVVSVLHYLLITIAQVRGLQQSIYTLNMLSIIGILFVFKPLMDLFYELYQERKSKQ